MDRTAIVKAFEGNLWDRAAYLVRARKDTVIQDTQDLLLVDSGLPVAAFNTIGRSELHPRFGLERIDAAIKHFKSKSSPFTWILGPLSGHGKMEQSLKDSGLTGAEEEWMMAMMLDTATIPSTVPPGLEMKRVTTTDEVKHFAEVVANSTTPPDENVKTFYTDTKDAAIAPGSPLRLYIGYVNKEPVAVLEAYMAHNILNFYAMAGLASTRGKGYTVALMLKALNDAKKVGTKLAGIQSPEATRAVYERLGFKPAARIVAYR